MKTYTTFIMSITLVFSGITFAAENEVKNKTSKAFNEESIRFFLSTFETFQELLDAYRAMGVFSTEDLKNASEFLKTNRIKLSDTLPKPILKNGGLQFGKVGWAYQSDGSYKTFDGWMIKVVRKQSPEKFFESAFNALEKRSTANSFNLFGETAEAQEGIYIPTDGGVAALGAVADITFRSVSTGLEVMGNMETVVLGSISEAIFMPVRKFYYQGKVTCNHLSGRFEVIDSFSVNDIQSHKALEATCDKTNPGFIGFSTGLCNASLRTTEFFLDSFDTDSRAQSVKVTDEALHKIFGEEIPECNDVTKLQVQKVLKNKSKQLFVKDKGDVHPEGWTVEDKKAKGSQ